MKEIIDIIKPTHLVQMGALGDVDTTFNLNLEDGTRHFTNLSPFVTTPFHVIPKDKYIPLVLSRHFFNMKTYAVKFSKLKLGVLFASVPPSQILYSFLNSTVALLINDEEFSYALPQEVLSGGHVTDNSGRVRGEAQITSYSKRTFER